ncbi:WYL domain-containing protein [Acinetobacter baumannii]|uniref:helix-turn-helix transcriptional regulator n=1 Tax=Acinetobacter baumannii TaxID=470 RepID=UPI003461C27A
MAKSLKAHERLAERLANIITRLNRGEYLDPNELTLDFGVTKKTIQRDIERLSIAGLPLVIDEKTKKFHLGVNYVGKISPKDIQNFAQLSGITGLYPNLDLSFLRELLDSRSSEVYAAKGYFFENTANFSELFKLIREAIQDRKHIAFQYNSKLRTVQPYKLIHHHGSWYLAAVRNDQLELRAYRLSRIGNDCQIQHHLDQFEPDIEIIKQLKNEESIWFGKEKKEIVLSVQYQAAEHFEQRQLFPEQQIMKKNDDGGLIISSRIAHQDQIKSLIRFWIPYVKVISPVELQQSVENDLKSYLEISF